MNSITASYQMRIRSDSFDSAISDTQCSESSNETFVRGDYRVWVPYSGVNPDNLRRVLFRDSIQAEPYKKMANVTLNLTGLSVTITMVSLIIFSIRLAESLQNQEMFNQCQMDPTIAATLGPDFCMREWGSSLLEKNGKALNVGVITGLSTVFTILTCVYTHFFRKLDAAIPLQIPLRGLEERGRVKMLNSVGFASICNFFVIATLAFSSFSAVAASQFADCTRSMGYCDNPLIQYAEEVAISFGVLSLINLIGTGALMRSAIKQRQILVEHNRSVINDF